MLPRVVLTTASTSLDAVVMRGRSYLARLRSVYRRGRDHRHGVRPGLDTSAGMRVTGARHPVYPANVTKRLTPEDVIDRLGYALRILESLMDDLESTAGKDAPYTAALIIEEVCRIEPPTGIWVAAEALRDLLPDDHDRSEVRDLKIEAIERAVLPAEEQRTIYDRVREPLLPALAALISQLKG